MTGLYRTPTVLATCTLTGMVWALSSRFSVAVRILVFLDSSLILFLTASRMEAIAAFVLILCALVIKAQSGGSVTWIKRSFIVFVLVILAGGAVFGIYTDKFAHSDTAGPLPEWI